MSKIFVYGSLMLGEGNSPRLETSQFLGTCKTAEGYDLISLGPFPGLIIGTGQVIGELYEVEDDELWWLDKLEGHPILYTRMFIELEHGLKVQSYLLLDAHYQGYVRVPSGNWRNVVRLIPFQRKK